MGQRMRTCTQMCAATGSAGIFKLSDDARKRLTDRRLGIRLHVLDRLLGLIHVLSGRTLVTTAAALLERAASASAFIPRCVLRRSVWSSTSVRMAPPIGSLGQTNDFIRRRHEAITRAETPAGTPDRSDRCGRRRTLCSGKFQRQRASGAALAAACRGCCTAVGADSGDISRVSSLTRAGPANTTRGRVCGAQQPELAGKQSGFSYFASFAPWEASFAPCEASGAGCSLAFLQ